SATDALSIERWILSLGMDCALSALTAARRRAFMSGSGAPIFAATVISRLSLENIAERFLSCAPLRYMMFLYLLWPAISQLNPVRAEPVEALPLYRLEESAALRQAQG